MEHRIEKLRLWIINTGDMYDRNVQAARSDSALTFCTLALEGARRYRKAFGEDAVSNAEDLLAVAAELAAYYRAHLKELV